MKPFLVLLPALLIGSAVFAQPQPDSTFRDVKLKIVDRKGKAMPGIVVQTAASDRGFLTDRNGAYVFSGLTDKDSVVIMLPRYGRTVIPVTGMDSLVVRVKSARAYSYYDQAADREVYVGYNRVKARDMTAPSSSVDVQAILQHTSVNSLYDLLVGRVAGLDIRRGANNEMQSTMRGTKSFYGSNEPLVVVDGITFESLQAADAVVNVRDIKRIDVLKDGAIYGSRGANGVIIITTK